MGTHALRLFCLVAVVASAGCAGLFGGGPTETLTPAPAPETPAQPAPGVTGDGRVSVERLLAADAAVRNGTSYRFERTLHASGPDGSLRIERVRHVLADGRVREDLAVDGTGDQTPAIRNGTLWDDGEVLWTRTRLEGGRTVTNRLLSGSASPFGLGEELPGRVLTATDFDVQPRRGGVVLESTGPFSMSRPVAPVSLGQPRNASARLVVGSEGLVRSLRLSYDASLRGETATVTIRQNVTGVGRTSASRPPWVPDNGTTVAAT